MGMFLSYTFNEELGTYFVIDDHFDSGFGLYGLGLTTPVIQPFVQGFVELGRTYGPVIQTTFSVGLWFVLTKRVTSW